MSDDIYTRACAKVLGIPEDQVTRMQRENAKRLCFATMYRVTEKPRSDEELFEEVCGMLRTAWKVNTP